MNDDQVSVGLFVLFVVGMILYFLPSIIAFSRDHHYRWIIFAINLVAGVSGIGYLAAFVWSVWPRQTAAFDIVASDLTTNSVEAGQQIYGRLGQNARAFREGAELQARTAAGCSTGHRGDAIRESLGALQDLARLKNDGVISETEFVEMKQRLLDA